MRLITIRKITGSIKLLTGLHIGGSDTGMQIGGTDNPVIRDPISNQPYIPGSSIKGKMRSLLEWDLGLVGLSDGKPFAFEHLAKIDSEDNKKQAKNLLRLFGGAPNPSIDQSLIIDIGPTRLSVWDCGIDSEWVRDHQNELIEIKTENVIDRIKGGAEHPRHIERVSAGAIFNFALSLRVHESDGDRLESLLIRGLHLLQLTGLGGSSSRGYGKVEFCLDDNGLQQQLNQQI